VTARKHARIRAWIAPWRPLNLIQASRQSNSRRTGPCSTRSRPPAPWWPVIQDGNGRWARQRNLPGWMGHREGRGRRLKRTLRLCSDWGISALTTYASPPRTGIRPREEVSFLMTLFGSGFWPGSWRGWSASRCGMPLLGDLRAAPRRACSQTDQLPATAPHRPPDTGDSLQRLPTYGRSGSELVQGPGGLAGSMGWERGELRSQDAIEMNRLRRPLQTVGEVEPDLLIRTSGEYRQHFPLVASWPTPKSTSPDVLWPISNVQALVQALLEFSDRQRRFGGVTATAPAPVAPPTPPFPVPVLDRRPLRPLTRRAATAETAIQTLDRSRCVNTGSAREIKISCSNPAELLLAAQQVHRAGHPGYLRDAGFPADSRPGGPAKKDCAYAPNRAPQRRCPASPGAGVERVLSGPAAKSPQAPIGFCMRAWRDIRDGAPFDAMLAMVAGCGPWPGGPAVNRRMLTEPARPERLAAAGPSPPY